MEKTRKPEYQLYKPRNCAKVRIDGKDHYLGPYGSPESHERYDELITAWLSKNTDVAKFNLTVGELVLLYLDHAKQHYRKAGRPTSEIKSVKLALRHVVALHRNTKVREFGPKALKQVRQRMIDAGYVRVSINLHIGRIRRMFSWGVSEELFPVQVLNALETVQGLQYGRTAAGEGKPVKPVPVDRVEAIQPFVSRPVWGAIQVQLLTGMRPGEVLAMRGCDLNMAGEVWEYNIAGHKTVHHGKERLVLIGPKAQAVLRDFLKTDLQAPLFSPRDGRAEYLARFKGPGRRNKTGTRKRQAAEFYTPESYHVAIRRACEKAFGMPDELRDIDRSLPEAIRKDLKWKAAEWRELNCWHPHRLRHTAATLIRREAGIETARCVLGHSSVETAQIYAEADIAKARAIMLNMG